MDFKGFIKKYWFVCLVGIVLAVFVGIYAADAYENRELTVNSKQVDGNYAVYSVDGEYVFADEFFDSLYTQNGATCALNKFMNAVLNSAYETTEEMEDNAATMAYNAYVSYGAEQLESELITRGYENGINDLSQLFVDQLKLYKLEEEYANKNWDTLYASYDSETEKPRMVYHILINVADVTNYTNDEGIVVYTPNPTEEEQAKIDAVVDALKEGKDFFEVQEEYNEDGSNSAYFVDSSNTSNLVYPFLNTALELEDGETSDLVATSYGYHIIKNYGADKELLLSNRTFIYQLYNSDSQAIYKALMEKADELGYELVNEELANIINAQLEESEDGE